ncbi:hypothetical protein Y032_0051g2114 [Ancylostoma ceylanicum]|uniref:Uncharacterized protein n=1 Tax=Ancylostoma ceylanicum TaxID=53326 RepID=A0A016U7X2_9BILA|nr:hypothetical protein Y032_0051g2114 [Ancylostoma ceylanicum]
MSVVFSKFSSCRSSVTRRGTGNKGRSDKYAEHTHKMKRLYEKGEKRDRQKVKSEILMWVKAEDMINFLHYAEWPYTYLPMVQLKMVI